MTLLTNIKRNLINVRGFRTNRKLVVIESDDWGSIRMPSAGVYEDLLRQGYHPDRDPYLRYDSIECNEDLEKLFDVLVSVKDSRGNHAVLTANAVMANPDFEKIRESGFTRYYYEPFTDTLGRYENRDRVYKLWKKGMEMAVFIPQYHGREHLNVAQWMRDLGNKDEILHKAFNLGMISISSVPGRMKFAYMEGMDHFSEEERLAKKDILVSGHQLFVSLVGYPSRSFIANCYIWDDTVEEVLKEQGVRTMQGILNQIKPVIGGKHQLVKHYMGEKNDMGMTYTIRNVFFEPSLDSTVDWVEEGLARVGMAFRWKKPAIIGSHRLNYIGAVDPANRDRNLDKLNSLLKGIVRKWPDVEFVSSADLAEMM